MCGMEGGAGVSLLHSGGGEDGTVLFGEGGSSLVSCHGIGCGAAAAVYYCFCPDGENGVSKNPHGMGLLPPNPWFGAAETLPDGKESPAMRWLVSPAIYNEKKQEDHRIRPSGCSVVFAFTEIGGEWKWQKTCCW